MAKELKTEIRNTHQTREAWMAEFYKAITPYIESCSPDNAPYVLPANIRFCLGFTSRGRKAKRQAQVLPPETTDDGSYELVVTADIADRVELGGQIMHGCGHLLTGLGHKARFKEYCLRVGLNVDLGFQMPCRAKSSSQSV